MDSDLFIGTRYRMVNVQEISVQDQHLVLLPDRALFWKEDKLLVVADSHFGKAQVFRDTGIPIPRGTTPGDLERLSSLVYRLQPQGLLFLGDIIHGRIESSVGFNRLIGQWRQSHLDVEFLLATGNHDRRAVELISQFRFDQVSAEITRGPFIFSHKPKPKSAFYGIAGHVHPVVTVKGRGRLKETLPCFCFGSRAALLPAFGSFTGNQKIRPSRNDSVYVIADDNVFKL